ncbi:hypothetical protein UFOVP273_3 [uncultured Caudovirales phage]|uniref:Uncharacterized protein n=1 Tax=uncultured Caudovirales phage TaxID=2100421 RepID=A0A6J5LIL1_9CAUD|nr:hypothetical protein UFOVP273_3 [uncultured Caudovirales phage]
MSTPVTTNFKMYQGSTFKEVIRWESSNLVFKTITGITKAAPVVITAPAHGVPKGWRILTTDISGTKELNDASNYKNVTDVTTDTLVMGEINGASYTAYTTGGIVTYYAPVNLAGYTARMQIREKIDSTTTLFDLTTSNGGIVIDTANSTITITISATSTALATFSSGVYSLEMVDGAGNVTTLLTGKITLVKEVTR